jgi:hypothetical protein
LDPALRTAGRHFSEKKKIQKKYVQKIPHKRLNPVSSKEKSAI